MIEQSRMLVDAMTMAYRPHVMDRLTALGIELDDETELAIEEGRHWLNTELTGLLSKPFSAQRRGPLELFQEAMRFPTAALQERGMNPVDRDHVAEAALPGDLFDLAPASSNLLGDDVWQAHLAWGAAKAAAMTAGTADS